MPANITFIFISGFPCSTRLLKITILANNKIKNKVAAQFTFLAAAHQPCHGETSCDIMHELKTLVKTALIALDPGKPSHLENRFSHNFHSFPWLQRNKTKISQNFFQFSSPSQLSSSSELRFVSLEKI